MSRPRFLADEDLRYEIVLAVRRREPTVEFPTVRDLGRAGATDADVLALANTDGWIVVSHDVSTLRAEADERVRDGRRPAHGPAQPDAGRGRNFHPDLDGLRGRRVARPSRVHTVLTSGPVSRPHRQSAKITPPAQEARSWHGLVHPPATSKNS